MIAYCAVGYGYTSDVNGDGNACDTRIGIVTTFTTIHVDVDANDEDNDTIDNKDGEMYPD